MGIRHDFGSLMLYSRAAISCTAMSCTAISCSAPGKRFDAKTFFCSVGLCFVLVGRDATFSNERVFARGEGFCEGSGCYLLLLVAMSA
jgi:hypothetical protein